MKMILQAQCGRGHIPINCLQRENAGCSSARCHSFAALRKKLARKALQWEEVGQDL